MEVHSTHCGGHCGSLGLGLMWYDCFIGRQRLPRILSMHSNNCIIKL